MNKQNVGYSYRGMLFAYKIEWSTDTDCRMMNLENITKGERSQSQKATYILWFHLYGVSRIGKFIDTESRLVFA